MKHLPSTNAMVVRENTVVVVAPFVIPHVSSGDPLDEPDETVEVTTMALVAVILPAVVKSVTKFVVGMYNFNVESAVFAFGSLYVSRVKVTARAPLRLQPLSVTSVSPEHLLTPL